MDQIWCARDRSGYDLSSIFWTDHCIVIYSHIWPSRNLIKRIVYNIYSPVSPKNADDSGEDFELKEEGFEVTVDDVAPREPTLMRPLNTWNSPLIRLDRNSFLFKMVSSTAGNRRIIKDCLVFNTRTGLLNHITDDFAPVELDFNEIDVEATSAAESVNYYRPTWEKYSSLNKLKMDSEHTDLLSKFVLWKFNGNSTCYEVFLVKVRTWRRLQVLLSLSGMSGELELIGSTFTGLADMKSDLDLNLKTNVVYGNLSPSWINFFNLLKFQMVLNRYKYITCIKLKKSQTPSIRCVITSHEDTTGRSHIINVDVYCNSDYTASTKLVAEMISKDWIYQPLLVILKIWLNQLRKYNRKTEFINSYTITLLGISFFQIRANAKVTAVGDNVTRGNTLWDLFIEFFAYYSRFDFSNAVISVRLGRILSKNEYRLINLEYDNTWIQYMSVEDPGFKKNTAQNIRTNLILAQNVAAFKATYLILLKAAEKRDCRPAFKVFTRFTI